MLVQPAQHTYRTWIIDSRRWQHYRPRLDDIIIATYPKCGTTWMQRIVGLLVFQTPDPQPITQASPWIDRRFPEPVEAMVARIEAQSHRRFLKSHLPFDGQPIYDEIKYIHVARDGRDACLSFHNHGLAFTAQALEALDRPVWKTRRSGVPIHAFPPIRPSTSTIGAREHHSHVSGRPGPLLSQGVKRTLAWGLP